MTLYKTYAQLERELIELQTIHDNTYAIMERYRNENYELQKKVADLRGVCERLSEINMKMSGDMLTIKLSRERTLTKLTEVEQWAERTQTSFEKALLGDMESRYPGFFREEAA